MPSFGAADLLVLLVFVVLVLDSRRLRAFARATGRARHDLTGGIPAGAHPDRVGLTLRQIQMRHHVDWEDGGIGWDGPEILPTDESAEPEPTPALLPVLWKPFPALPAAGATGNWLQRSSTTSSPMATRPPVTTAA